ncbi:MAG: hypothetical protein LBQ27_05300 [Clostridiales bacterium]|jgi:hypothetical protein|nr:hypothetical protein [Clostridiales bacterium]
MSGNREYAYEVLSAACRDLMSTKLILSSGKIAEILKVIATNDILKNVVADCMVDFNYERELKNCYYDFGSKLRFRLPPSSKKVVALVVNLLYDFDSGAINFVEFITNSFHDVRSEDSYKNFGDNVLTPFLEHANKLIFLEKEFVVGEAEKIDERINYVNSALGERVDNIISRLHRLVIENVLPDGETIHFMIDGLGYTLELRDIRLIKIAFFGLKTMLKGYRQFSVIVDELEGLFRMYSIK